LPSGTGGPVLRMGRLVAGISNLSRECARAVTVLDCAGCLPAIARRATAGDGAFRGRASTPKAASPPTESGLPRALRHPHAAFASCCTARAACQAGRNFFHP
jgi:hypothetical protein